MPGLEHLPTEILCGPLTLALQDAVAGLAHAYHGSSHFALERALHGLACTSKPLRFALLLAQGDWTAYAAFSVDRWSRLEGSIYSCQLLTPDDVEGDVLRVLQKLHSPLELKGASRLYLAATRRRHLRVMCVLHEWDRKASLGGLSLLDSRRKPLEDEEAYLERFSRLSHAVRTAACDSLDEAAAVFSVRADMLEYPWSERWTFETMRCLVCVAADPEILRHRGLAARFLDLLEVALQGSLEVMGLSMPWQIDPFSISAVQLVEWTHAALRFEVAAGHRDVSAYMARCVELADSSTDPVASELKCVVRCAMHPSLDVDAVWGQLVGGCLTLSEPMDAASVMRVFGGSVARAASATLSCGGLRGAYMALDVMRVDRDRDLARIFGRCIALAMADTPNTARPGRPRRGYAWRRTYCDHEGGMMDSVVQYEGGRAEMLAALREVISSGGAWDVVLPLLASSHRRPRQKAGMTAPRRRSLRLTVFDGLRLWERSLPSCAAFQEDARGMQGLELVRMCTGVALADLLSLRRYLRWLADQEAWRCREPLNLRVKRVTGAVTSHGFDMFDGAHPRGDTAEHMLLDYLVYPPPLWPFLFETFLEPAISRADYVRVVARELVDAGRWKARAYATKKEVILQVYGQEMFGPYRALLAEDQSMWPEVRASIEAAVRAHVVHGTVLAHELDASLATDALLAAAQAVDTSAMHPVCAVRAQRIIEACQKV